ncbi:MAG: T9SS type A sorting domain-containing protein, partial [Bacteroidetes bacterium]|nr:T9SS type A sorting domain-containing protein [Bacteroidota bacterium]
GGYHQGFFNFDLEASPTDPNKIWIATIRLTESSDGGQTYQSIGAANSTRLGQIHADVQDLEVLGSDIWVATDGGIDYSNDNLMSHTAVNRGIQAAHFWGFNTGWNEDSYTGGKYHDGTSGWYESYGNGKAYNIGGVEEASGYVHPIESRKMLYRTHYSSSNTSVKSIPSVFGNDIITHPSFPVRPNESYSVAQRSGVYFDPRYANHIYVGLENKVYKSTDGGINFEVLFTFPDENGEIYEMEISRSNPNVIYGVYNKLGGYWDPCEIWKSIDSGVTWNKTASDPEGNNRRFRISVHPQDENIVWICTPRGNNGQKVFHTSDGGAVWHNKTTDVLDDEDLTDILYQGGTNDIVYVTSKNGVFYWDSGSDDWINYSEDLPLITKSLQINPFYRDAELRLGTKGRGVWGNQMQDTLFSPIAQPITYSDIISCPSDTIHFDCYSMLRHEGASWQWSISPTPEFIDADNIRNPTVIFGTPGVYDVGLTVTDSEGNTDTKNIAGMVTVLDDCRPCESFGNMAWATAVTLVDFNGISNATGKSQPYTDYTSTDSTIVELGSSHDLNVHLNTDGNYTVHGTAWIDWNQDLDFVDNGETYYLGSAVNTADGPTNLSPLSIQVPMDAQEGKTVMRVSARYSSAASECEAGFDGEVEDYSVIVRKHYFVQILNFNLCSGDSIFIGGDWQNVSGTYNDTIPISPAIDSVYINTLTVHENSSSEIQISTCDTYVTPSGNAIYSESGIYLDTVPNYLGCDSFLTIDLEVVTIDTSVDVNLPVLASQAINAIYQWINCETMQVIPGANLQSFMPTTNGSYAVIVTNGNCTDTSSCYQVTATYDLENDFGSDLKVYPNPTNGTVVVELGSIYEAVDCKIRDISGRVISVSSFKETNPLYLKIEGSAGNYLLEISASRNKKATIVITKE